MNFTTFLDVVNDEIRNQGITELEAFEILIIFFGVFVVLIECFCCAVRIFNCIVSRAKHKREKQRIAVEMDVGEEDDGSDHEMEMRTCKNRIPAPPGSDDEQHR